MEQLTKNQAVATSQEAVQNQNEPQLRDENAHNDKSVHGVLNPTYQAGLRRDAVQPDIEAERKKRDEIEAGKSYCSRRFGGATCDDKSAQIYARLDRKSGFSRNAETELVCRLLLEKKNTGGGEPIDRLLGRVASDGRFHRLALRAPDFLRARNQILTHLGEQLLRGGGTRSHRLELEIQRVAFGLVAFAGLIPGSAQRGAFVLARSERHFHLLDPSPRRDQSALALGEAAGQARALGERLIERRLQGALVGLQQREFFSRERAFGLQFDDTLVGDVGVIHENLICLAQRPGIGGLLRQMTLEIGDRATCGHELAGKFGLVALESARGL